jgi:hypothetical protein
MRPIVAIVLAAICTAVEADKTAPLIPSEIIALAMAPTEKITALMTDSPRAIWFISSRPISRVELPQDVTAPQLLWSADARYLSLEYQINDDVSAVKVIDIAQNPPALIDVGRGHAARWSVVGHRLFVVPDFGVDELPKVPGLIVFDPTLRRTEVIARDYHFIGRYDVGPSRITAQVIQFVQGKPVFAVIGYDLKSGISEIVVRVDH